MKFKIIIPYLVFLISGLFVFSSCDKILNEQPLSTLVEEQFWLSNADAESGVAAIYDAMQKHFNIRHYLWGEFRGDSYSAGPSATGGSLELLNNTIQPGNRDLLRWNLLYQMIARANIAIEKIPTITGYDKNLLAEAYILRAYAYFEATKVWGAVPLYKEAIKTLDDNISRPRTPAATIMNETIIPDMLEAEKLMTRQISTYRFSRMGIFAFQANVYMFLKDYAKAKAALTNIVNSRFYTLTTTREDWQKMFLNDAKRGGKQMTGPELIFSIRNSLTEDADRAGIYNIFFAGLPSYYIAPRLENKWIQRFPIDSATWTTLYPTFIPKTKKLDGTVLYGDWRYFDSREGVVAIGLSRVAKYNKENYSGTFDDSDTHIYRYANVILLLAEAENQLGNTAAAVALVNQLRTARQLPTIAAATFTSKEALEDYILDERQMELLGEGQRWWDLVRTGKAVSTMGPINGQTEQKILFPIFVTHLIDNPNLTQNAGY
jgi:starch-binding outer membrane protein, SusD/RagB family